MSRRAVAGLWVLLGCALLVAAAAVQFGLAAALLVAGVCAVGFGLLVVDVEDRKGRGSA